MGAYETTPKKKGRMIGFKEPMAGEPMEIVLARAQKSGQPIQGGVTPLLYPLEDDENGRLATDIRTDKMSVATRMIDKWNNSKAKGKESAETALGEASEMARGEATEA